MKRDLLLQKYQKSQNVIARKAINKGLPYNNETLGDIELNKLNLEEDLRKGTAHIQVFEK